MIFDDIVTHQPLWVLIFAIFIGLVACEYAGAIVTKRLQERLKPVAPDRDGLDYVVSSAFALLGLLVAFTFGMALDRYEARRDLVVQEANAIGTAHIRTAFANEPGRTALREQLEIYAENRLAYGNATFDKKAVIAAKSAALRAEIAVAGVNASQNISSAPLGPSLIASMNDVIDIGSAREAANLARVPPSVLFLLLGYALISAFLMGYVQADSGARQRLASRILFMLLTLSLVTILDLDRPAGGAIKVSQQPIIDLIASFS
ncbi:MAG: hypothetical protein RLZZ58_1741 [Pseudomonadota bacterium]